MRTYHSLSSQRVDQRTSRFINKKIGLVLEIKPLEIMDEEVIPVVNELGSDE